MDKQFLNDVFQWDVASWSESLEVWKLPTNCIGKGAGFGEREGGLSLLMAKHGFDTFCTDYNMPEKTPFDLHVKHSVEHQISYQKEDITNVSFDAETFNIVMFKSVIGALNDKERQYTSIQELYRIIKPGGQLLFAENLKGTFVHSYARKKFTSWGYRWRYPSLSEVKEMLSDFKEVEIKTFGFLATFGRTEKQRHFLYKIDRLISPIIPNSKKYIVAVKAVK